MNPRSWREWSDEAPEFRMAGVIEGEFVDEYGRIAYTESLHPYHYVDGSQWGHSTGSFREGTWKAHHPRYHRWRFTGPTVPTVAAQGRSIIVWRWRDGPGELRALSDHGGDEDYVALVPGDAETPSWMDTGTSFGCCSVSEHELPDGRRVYIGAHA